MEYLFLRPATLSPLQQRRERGKKALAILKELLKEGGGEFFETRSDYWIRQHQKMQDHLSEETILVFQSDPLLGPHIVGGSGHHFIDRLEKTYGTARAVFFLNNHMETLCGDPKDLAVKKESQITVTSMRHIYHLSRVHDYVKSCYTGPVQFIEIGGGFGNLARMIRQYHLCSTYFIVDFPPLLSIQYFFLSEFLPESSIAVLSGNGKVIAGSPDAEIRLMPPDCLPYIAGTLSKPYGVLSTVALTEMSRKGQEEYLSLLDPDFIYLFGQLQNLAGAGGVSLDEEQVDSRDLIISLAERFHTVEYEYSGYFFEYLGRSAG